MGACSNLRNNSAHTRNRNSNAPNAEKYVIPRLTANANGTGGMEKALTTDQSHMPSNPGCGIHIRLELIDDGPTFRAGGGAHAG